MFIYSFYVQSKHEKKKLEISKIQKLEINLQQSKPGQLEIPKLRKVIKEQPEPEKKKETEEKEKLKKTVKKKKESDYELPEIPDYERPELEKYEKSDFSPSERVS